MMTPEAPTETGAVGETSAKATVAVASGDAETATGTSAVASRISTVTIIA